jgi:hypothetical protein
MTLMLPRQMHVAGEIQKTVIDLIRKSRQQKLKRSRLNQFAAEKEGRKMTVRHWSIARDFIIQNGAELTRDEARRVKETIWLHWTKLEFQQKDGQPLK